MRKIKRKVFRNTSQIAQCENCNWSGDGTKEAIKHCKKTGHNTICETNSAYYYSLSK
jgi:hypothetical protein